LELDNWLILSVFFLAFEFLMAAIDAPDFYESPFWKDSNPESGLGGWGDPNADFSVPDGGFNKFHLSYPSQHILRRNFTLRPYDSAHLTISAAFFPDPKKEANASFSASAIEPVIETPAGDYKGFQAALEAFEVKDMGMSDR
jgi:tyrosinase